MVAAGLATSALPWLKTEGMQMADAFFTLVRQGDPRYSQLNGSAMTSVPAHVVADYKVPHVPQLEVVFAESACPSVKRALEAKKIDRRAMSPWQRMVDVSFEIMKLTNMRGVEDMTDLEKRIEDPPLSNDPTKDLQEWRQWIKIAVQYGASVSMYRQAQGIKKFLGHVYKRCKRPEQLEPALSNLPPDRGDPV